MAKPMDWDKFAFVLYLKTHAPLAPDWSSDTGSDEVVNGWVNIVGMGGLDLPKLKGFVQQFADRKSKFQDGRTLLMSAGTGTALWTTDHFLSLDQLRQLKKLALPQAVEFTMQARKAEAAARKVKTKAATRTKPKAKAKAKTTAKKKPPSRKK